MLIAVQTFNVVCSTFGPLSSTTTYFKLHQSFFVCWINIPFPFQRRSITTHYLGRAAPIFAANAALCVSPEDLSVWMWKRRSRNLDFCVPLRLLMGIATSRLIYLGTNSAMGQASYPHRSTVALAATQMYAGFVKVSLWMRNITAIKISIIACSSRVIEPYLRQHLKIITTLQRYIASQKLSIQLANVPVHPLAMNFTVLSWKRYYWWPLMLIQGF